MAGRSFCRAADNTLAARRSRFDGVARQRDNYRVRSIANTGELVIPNGADTVIADITGDGTTIVSDGARLTARSIVQDTLIIGGYDSTLRTPPQITAPASIVAASEPGTVAVIAPTSKNPAMGVSASNATVPEPSTFVLLVLAGLALAGAYLRRK